MQDGLIFFADTSAFQKTENNETFEKTRKDPR